MFCKFETIRENVHKCKICGFEISSKQDPSKINKRCSFEEPNLLDKAISVSKAIVTHIADGATNVDVETENKRRDLCQGNGEIPKCEYFNNDKCGHCGCSLMSQKWKWRTSICPIGKW